MPYRKDTTRDAFLVSVWLSVVILIALFLLLLILVVSLFRDGTRPPFFASLKMLNESPILGILSVLRNSPTLMGGLQGLPASTKESKNGVRGLGHAYQMVRLDDEIGGYKLAIEVVHVPGDSGYHGDNPGRVIS